jgi:hypothetical protein
LGLDDDGTAQTLSRTDRRPDPVRILVVHAETVEELPRCGQVAGRQVLPLRYSCLPGAVDSGPRRCCFSPNWDASVGTNKSNRLRELNAHDFHES